MRAELFAEEGTLKGLILALEERENWIVGRDPDMCQLILEDPTASRMHARIEKKGPYYYIDNLSETNPVEINNHPISGSTLLQEGDRVKIGGTIFYFYPKGAPIAEIQEMEEADEPEGISHATIFKYEEEKAEDFHVDLTTPARFVLKVIAGPNSGAEFALDENKPYLLGTDTATCDIVFHDLSVSRQHARMVVGPDEILIEDLKSRNGIMIDRKRVEGKATFHPSEIVVFGTSAFLIVDREAPVRTIVSPTFELPAQEKPSQDADQEEQVSSSDQEEVESIAQEVPVVSEKVPRKPFPVGIWMLSCILGALAVLIGIGVISLFVSGQDITPIKRDFSQEISGALSQFNGVKFNYSPLTGRLFLVGHVLTNVEKNELLYNLRGLNFIRGIDDNVVIDECIWQEMNLVLGKNSAWKGISMHSPEPGIFVLTGYLQTNTQAASLTDYMMLNFPYPDRLKNLIVVEEQINEEVVSQLMQVGLGGVTPTFINGDLTLTGYINSSASDEYQAILEKLKTIPGVRGVKSFVVVLSPEKAVIDLHEKHANRYKVTGYATHCNVNINVVINGKMYTRGDIIDGLTITSIQLHTIYLEKDGLKYKIEYNK